MEPKREEGKSYVKRGLWKPEEDMILRSYVETHGEGNWADISRRSGLKRGGKSCRWSLIAGRLPGRTDNEVKNYWNTHLNKKSNSRKQNAPESIGATPFTDKPVMSTELRRSHGEEGEGQEESNTWMEETNHFGYDVHVGSPLPLISHYPDNTLVFDPCFAFTDFFPLL
ncbi:unnamed protein product [Arabidopsis arenosa]|uniref:Uncharacterized protein n=1 Tax=Arabidopsis arenosa TaxID=38785 RepID=A0A8S2B084_ARAAE|nr:unnamed protein product [Arabidopsis arenosa]